MMNTSILEGRDSLNISKQAILFVDDEEDILNSLKRALRAEPYEQYYVLSGEEALSTLSQQSIHVLVSDMRMPRMDGVMLLERVAEKYPDIIRMVISGWSDADSILDAVNTGHIYRYLVKPWDIRELKITLRQALEMYRLQAERREMIQRLKSHNLNLEKAVVQRTEQMMTMNQQASLGKYASQIVHNLNDPLGRLSSNIELIGLMAANQRVDMDQLKKQVVGAQTHLDQLKEIVSGILNHAKAEKSTQVNLININQIIKEELAYFNLNPIFCYEVKKVVNLAPNMPEIIGKPGQIKTVLNYLVQTALDAMTQSIEKKLIVETIWQQATILIRISHTGNNAPSEDPPPSFLKKMENASVGGTVGSQFSNVKSIIAAYSGKIELSSQHQGETTFKVTLPVGRSALSRSRFPSLI